MSKGSWYILHRSQLDIWLKCTRCFMALIIVNENTDLVEQTWCDQGVRGESLLTKPRGTHENRTETWQRTIQRVSPSVDTGIVSVFESIVERPLWKCSSYHKTELRATNTRILPGCMLSAVNLLNLWHHFGTFEHCSRRLHATIIGREHWV